MNLSCLPEAAFEKLIIQFFALLRNWVNFENWNFNPEMKNAMCLDQKKKRFSRG